MYEGSSDSALSPILIVTLPFDYSHPLGCEAVSHHALTRVAIKWLRAGASLHVLIGRWFYLLWRNVFSSPSPVFN